MLTPGRYPATRSVAVRTSSSLAVRGVNLFARFEFDLADGQDVFGALVQELDDLSVQPVNRLAMFGKVQVGA